MRRRDGVITLLGVDAVIAMVSFGIVWAICVRVRNYGFLDVTWTLSIGLLSIADGVLGSGSVARRVLFSGLGVAWSLRLGVFVLLRVLRHHPAEDKRYLSLRERWPTPGAFLVFFELQALIAVVFSAPFLAAAFAPDPRIGVVEWLGLGVASVGIVGEAIADAQSAAFKRRTTRANSASRANSTSRTDPTSRTNSAPGPDSTHRILDTGLWRYSRHPNYFFEIVAWVGFALAAIGLPYGGFAILCPLLIVYFLLRVTGVPLTEKHSLATHGEAYRDYQRRTSAVIPWPRRAEPTSRA